MSETNPRWYCVDRRGGAMLCVDEADALAEAIKLDACWPRRAPHRAVLLGDVAAERSRIAELLRQRGQEELARVVEGGE